MSRCEFQRLVRAGRAVVCAALLVGCTQTIHNEPINQPLTATEAKVERAVEREAAPQIDDMVVALSFSGGGMRAAAFSYGVLTGFDETPVRMAGGVRPLIDHIDFVSGVSGGSVMAAYYGLKRREALADFKQRFLLVNAEESLTTNLSFLNIAKGLQGGVNDSTQFPRWLDAHLFNGATFKDLNNGQRPAVWINASDIYNRTPFLFSPVTFNALCSDLANYPVAMAVAASAAVPVVFAPIVIQNFEGGCPNALPEWVGRVRNDDDAAPLIRTSADALDRYHSGEIKYVKLMDGGLVDNYGLAGFSITRLASRTPYGPLGPEEAVKLRRLLFLVVDSGRAPSGAWSQTVAGPSGVDLITAASDTATGSGAIGSYTAFDGIMDDYREDLVAWRCKLPEAERRRLGAPANWNCKDVKFFIGRLSFDQLGADRAAQLNAVETRFVLPPAQVDMLIDAGRDALKTNTVFREFLKSLSGAPLPRVLPVAPPQPGGPVSAKPGAQEAKAEPAQEPQ